MLYARDFPILGDPKRDGYDPKNTTQYSTVLYFCMLILLRWVNDVKAAGKLEGDERGVPCRCRAVPCRRMMQKLLRESSFDAC